MTPQLIFAIIALVQEAITLEPELQAQLQTIFSKPNPTPEDWQALRLQVLGKSYADYVPASALPAAGAGSVSGGAITQTTAETPVSGQPGASPEPKIAAEPEKSAETQIQAPAAAPYLPDGSRNPDFNHLAASPSPAAAS